MTNKKPLIDDSVVRFMDAVGKMLIKGLPEGVGFAVVCFEFNARPGTKNHIVSNADRTTLLAGLQQLVENQSMTKDDQSRKLDMITCVRVEDMPTPPGRGGVRSACADCKAPVWVAPGGQEVAAMFPTTPIVCIECMLARAEGSATEGSSWPKN